MVERNEDMVIAETILEQLGGRQFMAMTGAREPVAYKRGLTFGLPRGAARRINRVVVRLTADDTYDVEFIRVAPKKMEREVVEAFSGIYAEDLRGLFERTTGLATSLTRRYA